MKQYLESFSGAMDGVITPTRGTPTVSTFGTMRVYDCSVTHPIVTSKFQGIKNMITEMIWNITGRSDNNWLNDNGCHIWDDWDVEKFPVTEVIEFLEERGISIDSSQVSDDEIYKLAESLGMKLTTGNLGPVYGAMLTNWPTASGGSINQLRELIDNIRKNPFSRRHLISMWNPELLPDETKDHLTNIKNGKQVLPPCHVTFQVNVRNKPLFSNLFSDNEISDLEAAKLIYEQLQPTQPFHIWVSESIQTEDAYLQLAKKLFECPVDIVEELLCGRNEPIPNALLRTIYNHKTIDLLFFMRSNDKALGEPYNVSNYATLLATIAHCLDMSRGNLIHVTGNSHVYLDQLAGVDEMLSRTPFEPSSVLNIKDRDQLYLDEYDIDDFKLVGYQSHPSIKFEVNV